MDIYSILDIILLLFLVFLITMSSDGGFLDTRTKKQIEFQKKVNKNASKIVKAIRDNDEKENPDKTIENVTHWRNIPKPPKQ